MVSGQAHKLTLGLTDEGAVGLGKVLGLPRGTVEPGAGRPPILIYVFLEVWGT